MTVCSSRPPGAVELYFYGELTAQDHAQMDAHLRACAACRQALEELTVIRAALAARVDVSEPPGGDWTGFMSRLRTATVASQAAAQSPAPLRTVWSPLLSGVAAAALLALVTIAVLLVMRDPSTPRTDGAAAGSASLPPASAALAASDAALVQMSEAHFERAKLVVLGLATKDPFKPAEDWNYERGLATTLLDDTRLYRQAAEESGLQMLAGVMRDLELVLLQTAMSERPDPESLAQLQRLIRRRDLITKMNVVASTGLLP